MMRIVKLKNLFKIILAIIFLVFLPLLAFPKNITRTLPDKERLVLMPLRLSVDIQNMQGAMETSLTEGLQTRYTVFSGEKVTKKTIEIFHRESKKQHCDETKCLQDIAIAFQTELIAVANVTKIEGGYLLALSIRDVMNNESIYSKSIPCKECDAFQAVEQLKILCGAAETLTTTVNVVANSNRITLASNAQQFYNPRIFKDCPDCPEMVLIPAGGFDMGSPIDELGRYDNENPIHHVKLKSFLMGKHHITRGQFSVFVKETGYTASNECFTFESGNYKKRGGRSWRNPGYLQEDNHPVVCLNRNDANAYVTWLSKKTGKQYRLPSEAEWEYAARAGATSARYWGESPNAACDYANVGDHAFKNLLADDAWDMHNCNDGYAYTSPVGSFKPNALGLYDMQGNVWQWVADNWHENYKGAPLDGSVWKGDDAQGLLRGGSGASIPINVRSATRFMLNPEKHLSDAGFRVAKTLP